MANVTNEPPRIICTKCIRIVRVHFYEAHFADDTLTVATECCERIFGWISGEHRHSKRYSSDKSFTTSDITRMPVGDVEEYAQQNEERAAKATARATWSRWSAAK